MKIGRFNLDKEILVVAEIGNNHEGNARLAERMIVLASRAGAGAVKFQTIIPERLVSIKNKKRNRQLKRFCLLPKHWKRLYSVACSEGLLFLSTPFDVESALFLNSYVPAFKVASGDNNFYPLLKAIAQTEKPVLLSTGLSDIKQISKSKLFIERIWQSRKVYPGLSLLHCVTSYPTPHHEANLLAIRTLQEHFGVTVGYSDHTTGLDAAVIAITLGARIIEKHFTIDKNYSNYRDHHLSADPEEFALLVRKIKDIQAMLGNGCKRLQDCERGILNQVRRLIVARQSLMKGEVLKFQHLDWVRVEDGRGLAPGQEHFLINKTLRRNIDMGETIALKDVTKGIGRKR